MNKQLTKKSIGIAASAALIASVAFSGSALAGPGNSPDKGNAAKGEQTSIGVLANCVISNDQLIVSVTLTDKNEGTDKTPATLESVDVTGYKKFKPKEEMMSFNSWSYDAVTYPGLTCQEGGIQIDGNTCDISLDVDICAAIASGAKALEALVDVSTGTDGSKLSYTSQCKDSDLKLDAYKAACGY